MGGKVVIVASTPDLEKLCAAAASNFYYTGQCFGK